MKDILRILKKFPDYEVIPYETGLTCPYGDLNFRSERPNLIGWCETNIGHMVVCECPKCFARFRWHASDHWDDTEEEFRTAVEDLLYDDSIVQTNFGNGAELWNEISASVN